MENPLAGLLGRPHISFNVDRQPVSARVYDGEFGIEPAVADNLGLSSRHVTSLVIQAVGGDRETSASLMRLPLHEADACAQEARTKILPPSMDARQPEASCLAQAHAWQAKLFVPQKRIPGSFEPGRLAGTIIDGLASAQPLVQIATDLSSSREEAWTPGMVLAYTRQLLGRMSLGNGSALVTYRHLSDLITSARSLKGPPQVRPKWKGNESLQHGKGVYFNEDGWLQRVTFLGGIVAVDESRPISSVVGERAYLSRLQLAALGMRALSLSEKEKSALSDGTISQTGADSSLRTKLSQSEIYGTPARVAFEAGIFTTIKSIDIPGGIDKETQELIGHLGWADSLKAAAAKCKLTPQDAARSLRPIREEYGLRNLLCDSFAMIAHLTNLAAKYRPE